MFICSVGKHVSKPKETCTKVVTQTRPRIYDSREYIGFEGEILRDNGGQGWEIVKEEKRCEEHVNV